MSVRERGGADDRAGDAELIRACLAGAPGAFERLIEQNRRVVYHAIRGALERAGARDDAELCDEAFARTFATLAQADMKVLRSFQGRSRLATFLVVIARRVALRALADLRPRRPDAPAPVTTGAGGAPEPADTAPDPAARAEREEVRALVRESIDALSYRDGLAIRLFYDDDLSHREIGAILGVPVTHVGQILARAREKIRAKLERAGLDARREDALS